MSKTPIDEAREAVDESTSVLAMAPTSLSHICDALLDGKTDDGFRVIIGKESINSITWLASHVRELTQQHIAKWDRLDELIQGKADEPA